MFIWDFVASSVLSEILDWLYAQAVGFLGNFFAMMGDMGVELFYLPWVVAIVGFFSKLAWALYAVSIIVCAFECAVEYSSGRGNMKQTVLNILKGFMAVSLFTVVPVRLYALSVSLQGTLSHTSEKAPWLNWADSDFRKIARHRSRTPKLWILLAVISPDFLKSGALLPQIVENFRPASASM